MCRQPMSWHGVWLAALCLAVLGVAAHTLGSCSGRMASLHTQTSGRHRYVLCCSPNRGFGACSSGAWRVLLGTVMLRHAVAVLCPDVAEEAELLHSYSIAFCWSGAWSDCSMYSCAHRRNRTCITLMCLQHILWYMCCVTASTYLSLVQYC
jgi:hypothetical protein